MFRITSLSDWFKVLVPLFQPIRSETKTKTNSGSHMHIFPCFVSATCLSFDWFTGLATVITLVLVLDTRLKLALLQLHYDTNKATCMEKPVIYMYRRPLAQFVEHQAGMQEVMSSIPAKPTLRVSHCKRHLYM